MFFINRLFHYFTRYYLLAATASIIILGFIGSANVLFLTAMNPSFWGWVGLFFYSDSHHAFFSLIFGTISTKTSFRSFCYRGYSTVDYFGFDIP